VTGKLKHRAGFLEPGLRTGMMLTGGLALLVTACGSAPPPAPAEGISDSVGAWAEPAAYAFTMDAGCGFRVLNGPFRVIVRDSEAVDFADLDEPASKVTIANADVPTLGDMLDRVAEAREGPGAVVRFETDPADGHPTSVSIDWLVSAVDDEECYEITDYAPGGS
jgi:hypothetical protein